MLSRVSGIVCTLTILLGSFATAQGGPFGGPQGPYSFRPLNSWGVPSGVAEIVAATANGNTLVYTNSDDENLGVVDITDPTNPSQIATIPLPGEPTSVSILGTWAVAAVYVDQPDEGMPPPAFLPGKMVVVDIANPAAPVVTGMVDIGWQPDSIKLVDVNGTPVAVVCIENEPVVLDGMGLVTDGDLPGSPTDASPAGLIQVISVDFQTPANSTVVDVTLSPAALTSAGCTYSNDPQPEFVDIHGTTAAVSIQENNGIVLVDIADPANPSIQNIFNLGVAGNRPADLTEDDAISFTEAYPNGVTTPDTDGAGNPVTPGLRFPDAIAFTPNGNRILSADEGELNFTGGRGWSSWRLNGIQAWEDRLVERASVLVSHYPEGRSENKGIEMEGVTTGTFAGRNFAFVLSERGSFMAVYRLRGNSNPRLTQILPTGIEPEGVVAIESRGLVVTADEESGTLSIFQGAPGFYAPPASQPRLYTPFVGRPFAALSGLCAGWGNRLYAVPDNALPTEIYSIKLGAPFAKVSRVRKVKLNGQQMRYDGEGICNDTSIVSGWFGGWWIASEGNASSRANLLVQVNRWGNVRREIQLPASIDPAADPMLPGNAVGPAGGQTIRSNGFEGVTLSTDGRYLVTCIQRDFTNEFPTGPRYARIARYDLQQLQGPLSGGANVRVGGDWEFFYYQLDSNDPSNWAGLSEIITIGPGQYAVIERDKGIGNGSQLKKIYAFDLTGLTPDADGVPDSFDTVIKGEVVDVLDRFFPYEKIEGLALKNGRLWVGLDNDGGEVESRLVNTGIFVNPLGN